MQEPLLEQIENQKYVEVHMYKTIDVSMQVKWLISAKNCLFSPRS